MPQGKTKQNQKPKNQNNVEKKKSQQGIPGH